MSLQSGKRQEPSAALVFDGLESAEEAIARAPGAAMTTVENTRNGSYVDAGGIRTYCEQTEAVTAFLSVEF